MRAKRSHQTWAAHLWLSLDCFAVARNDDLLDSFIRRLPPIGERKRSEIPSAFRDFSMACSQEKFPSGFVAEVGSARHGPHSPPERRLSANPRLATDHLPPQDASRAASKGRLSELKDRNVGHRAFPTRFQARPKESPRPEKAPGARSQTRAVISPNFVLRTEPEPAAARPPRREPRNSLYTK